MKAFSLYIKPLIILLLPFEVIVDLVFVIVLQMIILYEAICHLIESFIS